MISFADERKMVEPQTEEKPNSMKFQLGKIVVTEGVQDLVKILMKKDIPNIEILPEPILDDMLSLVISELISSFLDKHVKGIWGELDNHDTETNNEAIAFEDDPIDPKTGYDKRQRILSCYKLKDNKIWVITEWDRSVTTILLPEEY